MGCAPIHDRKKAKKMKNRFLIFVILIILICFSLSSCSFLGQEIHFYSSEWEYDLPNGYALWYINRYRISCVERTEDPGQAHPVVPGLILEFCYDKRYVYIKRAREFSFIDTPYEEIDRTDPDYFIVDTEKSMKSTIMKTWSPVRIGNTSFFLFLRK